MRYIPTSQLEQTAAEILTEHDVLRTPIPIDVLAHRMGVRVEIVPLGEEISGVLVVEDGAGVIGVNAAHSTNRQRFSIAHELAHYRLHRRQQELFIDRAFSAVFRDHKSSRGEDRLEIQANQLAAALLMPRVLLEDELAQGDFDLGSDESLLDLARRFGVSREAMAFRISNLELF